MPLTLENPFVWIVPALAIYFLIDGIKILIRKHQYIITEFDIPATVLVKQKVSMVEIKCPEYNVSGVKNRVYKETFYLDFEKDYYFENKITGESKAFPYGVECTRDCERIGRAYGEGAKVIFRYQVKRVRKTGEFVVMYRHACKLVSKGTPRVLLDQTDDPLLAVHAYLRKHNYAGVKIDQAEINKYDLELRNIDGLNFYAPVCTVSEVSQALQQLT